MFGGYANGRTMNDLWEYNIDTNEWKNLNLSLVETGANHTPTRRRKSNIVKFPSSLFIFGLTTQMYSQTIELEDAVISINYKYLNAIDSIPSIKVVKKLEEKVLNYKNDNLTDLYEDEHDIYNVSFYIPEGKIVAAYDKNGKIIRTIEKYNNIRLPLVVMQAISKRFPNWSIVEDVYLVKYHCDADSLKQVYKVKIKNEDKVMSIKTNQKGEFI